MVCVCVCVDRNEMMMMIYISTIDDDRNDMSVPMESRMWRNGTSGYQVSGFPFEGDVGLVGWIDRCFRTGTTLS